MRDIWKCSNPLYENKPWLIKYFYSNMNVDTPEGARAHKKMAMKMFISVGISVCILVVLSFVLSKIL